MWLIPVTDSRCSTSMYQSECAQVIMAENEDNMLLVIFG